MNLTNLSIQIPATPLHTRIETINWLTHEGWGSGTAFAPQVMRIAALNTPKHSPRRCRFKYLFKYTHKSHAGILISSLVSSVKRGPISVMWKRFLSGWRWHSLWIFAQFLPTVARSVGLVCQCSTPWEKNIYIKSINRLLNNVNMLVDNWSETLFLHWKLGCEFWIACTNIRYFLNFIPEFATYTCKKECFCLLFSLQILRFRVMFAHHFEIIYWTLNHSYLFWS